MNDQVGKAKEQSRAEDVDDSATGQGAYVSSPEKKPEPITEQEWLMDAAHICLGSLDTDDMNALRQSIAGALVWSGEYTTVEEDALDYVRRCAEVGSYIARSARAQGYNYALLKVIE